MTPAMSLMKTATIDKATIRATLRSAFGSKNCCITRDDEIHIYGQMPNSIETGWYVYGWLGDADTMRRIDDLAHDAR